MVAPHNVRKYIRRRETLVIAYKTYGIMWIYPLFSGTLFYIGRGFALCRSLKPFILLGVEIFTAC